MSLHYSEMKALTKSSGEVVSQRIRLRPEPCFAHVQLSPPEAPVIENMKLSFRAGLLIQLAHALPV